MQMSLLCATTVLRLERRVVGDSEMSGGLVWCVGGGNPVGSVVWGLSVTLRSVTVVFERGGACCASSNYRWNDGVQREKKKEESENRRGTKTRSDLRMSVLMQQLSYFGMKKQQHRCITQ